MRMVYGPLQIIELKRLQNRTFVVLHQEVKCEPPAGFDYVEVAIFGFVDNYTIIRELLHEVDPETSLFEFEATMESYPNARIIRLVDHEPIFTPAEREFAKQGIIDAEAYARRQVVRFGDGLWVDRTGMPVFAQHRLSLSGDRTDQDYRQHIADSAVATDYHEELTTVDQEVASGHGGGQQVPDTEQ